jgi:lipoprotein-anchoring transpeptidase ErfK/SrfK
MFIRSHRSYLLSAAMSASVLALAGFSAPADALPTTPQAKAAQPTPKSAPTATAARAKPASAGAESAKASLGAKAKGVLSINISLDQQQLTLYSDGQPIAHSRVSTGKAGHGTPTGVFNIIQKDRYHRSNIYDNAPMYFMQRITWSGVALHQGIVPNYPASHGCVRLPEAFARQLWGITNLGVRVTISRNPVAPVAFSHPKLFAPKREPIEAPRDEIAIEAENTPAEFVRTAYRTLEDFRIIDSKPMTTASDASAGGDPAFDAMAMATTKTAALTVGPDARPLKPGPVSVFISRKEGKLFVRKGFAPVFNVPVTFERPDRAVGTHVFTALAATNDTGLRWTVMSLGAGAAAKPKTTDKAAKLPVPATPVATLSAAEALEGVTIPQDAIERISALMTPGASLIISDQGLGPETGNGTDFIVLTR